MPLSLEQTMITELETCTETSKLKTDQHEILKQMGYLNSETFNGESWSIRARNEEVSGVKRKILNEMIDTLANNHNLLVDRAQREKKKYKPDIEKDKNMILEEIDFQITQFHNLQTIMHRYKALINATISLTARGGESLKALEKCEAILEGAITGWIAQMQKDEFHTKGVFSIIFEKTKTRSAGTLFNEYVRRLVSEGIEVPRNNRHDPFSKDKAPALTFNPEVSGLYQLASYIGAASKAPLYFKKTRTIEMQTNNNIVSSSQQYVTAPLNLDNPPPYNMNDSNNENIVDLHAFNVHDAAKDLERGEWDAKKENTMNF